MNKTIIMVIAIIVVIGSGLAFVLAKSNTEQKNAGEQSARSTGVPAKTESNDSGGTNPSEVQEGEVLINIKGFAFSPSDIKIKKGTRVTWTNQDSAKHDVTPDEKSVDFVGSGKLLAQGESYTFTFNKVGNYPYQCTPHPFMKATIQVVE